MTAAHRPLSAWVSHFDGTTLDPVNDGDDRSDARAFAHFATGWARTTTPWGDTFALALTDGSATVVELDDYGRPIPVTPEIVRAVERVERDWPDALPDTGDLADAPLPLRYWLLRRLAAEGDPPDEVFALLPWDLLDRAVTSLLTTLDDPAAPGELVEMRHWLTPAVRGLTGPLEQLDHGLRTDDPRVARLGASGLLDNLRHIPLSRVPATSLARLVPLVRRLGAADPLYRHTARVVEARLVGESAPRMSVRLNSALDAAANDEDVREHTEAVADEAFSVRFDETQAGWVRVLVQVPKPTGGLFGDRADVFAPIRVAPRDESPEQRYWVALYPEGDKLVGVVSFALPRGWSEVDCDAVPASADDLAAEHPDVLLPSLHASIPPSARQWLEIADDLPAGHPARIAAQRFEESL
ncbi:hypothetical protein [Saccharothrix deserti]|uniref:hypothetical protein n=1 Tax=Saccharothrix deserti TaxID=2593674 RepID=UPI00131B017C|nr:hypothetical protein [Saccharothrix deserti]